MKLGKKEISHRKLTTMTSLRIASSVPTILVTGGTGYIASHIVQQLQQEGHKVRATVRSMKNKQKVEPLRHLCPNAKYPLELCEADLFKADSWLDAVCGCSYVMHTASPVPLNPPKDEMELITPAVEGTLAVLRACLEAGCVKRVVLTSSVAAVRGGDEHKETDTILSEDDWTNPKQTSFAYSKSKTLAEQAAWEFVSDLPDDHTFELAVINPALVLGPVIHGGHATSLEIMKMFLDKPVPALPHINLALVDVRDVAAAHVAAMTTPEAAGHRHIMAPHNMWITDIAEVLRDEFRPLDYNIPKLLLPRFVVRLSSLWDDRAKYLLMTWGRTTLFDTSRMISVLGIQPRCKRDTLINMAHSMIENGLIRKTPKYAQEKHC